MEVGGCFKGSSGRLRSFRNAESKGGGVDERVGKSATWWLLLMIVAKRERERMRGAGGDGRKKRSGIEFVVYEASNSHHSKLRSNTC